MGTMTADPESGRVVMPSSSICGVMFSSVTLVVAHIKVANSPEFTVAGVILIVKVGPDTGVTSKRAEVETEPPAPLAVAV